MPRHRQSQREPAHAIAPAFRTLHLKYPIESPPRQPFLPYPRDLTGVQLGVERYPLCILGIVAPHHCGQVGVLVRNRLMSLDRHQAVTVASARA